MAELGQQTVEFATLVHRATEDSFLSLKELVDKSKNSEHSDTEKKISLLKYLQKTRQRMLRLHVLAKWCQQVPVVRYCQQLASTLSSHDTCFTQAADSIFFMHEGLQQARAPIYDVPSAIEILLTGTYQRLPQCIDDLGILGTLDEDEQKPALKKLDILLRSKLLETSLPKEVSEVKVSDGTVLLRVDGEFKVLLTLGYRGHLSMWRILHLELLVGERSGFVKLEESRRHHLGDDLERRMAASENSFLLLYSILHELCVALTMDTIVRQAQALRQGRWKDVIRFELISDSSQDSEPESTSLKTPGLKILYWLDFEKKVGGSHLGSCPFIKIEPGQDLQIRCIHSTFVVDPQTDKEAELSLDQSCIDVEKLLLTAISCIRYTRLLEILRELRKNGQICQAADDVLLQYHGDKSEADQKKNGNKFNTGEYGGDEVLRVRVYGSAYISLGVNIRNGRFFLQSSRDILESSSLLECEDVLNQGSSIAADVFISLRSKSILRLFASIGRFLGLKVYEHGLAAVKIQKTILYGSDLLLMGFPHCGSSYFLLMQLDKDFKPLFRLLETQLNPSGKSHSVGESNNVINLKDINIGQMPMLEDELNLSLIDFEKVLSSFPNVVGTNENMEHGILSDFSIEPSMQITGSPHSVFSSVVDEVFEVEKGTSLVLPLSSPSNTSPITHLGSAQINQQRRIISPKWEVNNVIKNSNSSPHFNNVLYSNNLKGIIQANCVSSLPSSPGKTPSIQMLSASKSDQDLASLRSIHSVDAMDEDPARSSRLLSPLRRSASRAPAPSSKNGLRNSPSKSVIVSSRAAGPSLWTATPTYQAEESEISDVVKHEKNSRKRSLSDMLCLVPSLEGIDELNKRRKISESTQFPVAVQKFCSSVVMGKTEGCTYGNLLAEANKGNAPSSIYVSALLHVIRHSSLCIKHARLTSQMDALDISYIEESDLQTPTSNLWFRLPDASKDSWQHICLRLGKPGSVYWDVKINDQHFRDLWELQKGSTTTGWGCGVRIATTSDIDSHIHYDPEGVILSYTSVEDDSIKRLVADLRRLSNARLFSLGMRKLLGVRMDDKLEENSSNLENKITSGSRSAIEVADKMSEQIKIKKAFRIEAVGLMSLWFSFGPEVLARFVVEWESGKEGCTMHVSPDQLWPHTKFLEDFINGTEVASLLDCIRLTAGPLLHLASATRPARGSPASAPPMILPGYSSTIPKQNGLVGSPSNAVPPGNPVGSHSLQSAAVLAVAGRPGIVPSSLLPIDVSIVLRGPYWIRIIYRKDFAVDMRCFAGDQVWLQPATPPREGRTVGGSMPCPQFRPFIMEHVAQELNGLEPNFSNGLVNSNSPNQGSGSRVNVTSSGVIPKSSLAGLNRVSNGSVNSSISPASSGLPLRRNLGTGVPINVRGELNTAFIGLGDDGGYGGGWVPLVALKKVLRGILKYLGVLWLFAQLPELLEEILGSILKDKEGALLNLDQEQPALRFFVGGYVFAVSVHRVQLLLQVLSVKRFHQQQPPQNPQEELVQSETSEICDYFSRRVASEPYDASRVASFITLLTLPVSVLREFLKLIAWKKGSPATQAGEITPTQRPRIELCLENHSGSSNTENSLSKSNIHYDRPHNSVDFVLTVVLDPAHIPQINAAGGAAWLPYCVSVRLRYSFGESLRVSLLGMEGSHGGRACWLRSEDWEMCKQRVTRTVEVSGSSTGDATQGRLRHVADSLQKTMHSCLQGERGGIKEENQKI